jgi:hypothetical protein
MTKNIVPSRGDWELGCLAALVAGSAIVVRFWPHKDYIQTLIWALTLGTIANLYTLIVVTIAAIQRYRSSGVGVVSLGCYFWFLIASNYALVSIYERRWEWVLAFKALDALLLWSFTYLCSLPERFQPPPQSEEDS